jgi:hypothetical protein
MRQRIIIYGHFAASQSVFFVHAKQSTSDDDRRCYEPEPDLIVLTVESTIDMVIALYVS